MPIDKELLGLAALIVGAVIVIVTMAVGWWFVGRRFKPKFVVPRSEPPDGLSPAELSWVYGRAFGGFSDSRAVTATLFRLGLCRRLRIEEADGVITLVKLQQESGASDDDFQTGERTLLRHFLERYPRISWDWRSKRVIQDGTTALNEVLSKRSLGRIFQSHSKISIVGFVLSVAALTLFYLLAEPTDVWGIGVGVHYIASWILGALSVALYPHLTGRAENISFFNLISMLVLAGFSVLLMLELYDHATTRTVGDASAERASMLAAAAMGGSLAIFALNISKLTPLGRKVLEQMEGFRSYLLADGNERLTVVDVPVVTTERFERLLPHAIALGLERSWSEMFAKHLEETVSREEPQYRPWFSDGSSLGPDQITLFIERLVRTIEVKHQDLMVRRS